MTKEIEWKADRSRWMPGPWDQEPDRLEWRDRGFACIIVRQRSRGHLCGYLGVPPGHPWHGKNDGNIDADVHGGLTYASECNGAVCHVPQAGESDDVWWLGFDCAHGGDSAPITRDPYYHESGAYRNVAYVKAECARLVTQAIAAAEPNDP